ncbi:hypothetical protein chiPu_0024827, partial [Chiloscyllium punctatum]|nr:hypothetical protein [Chiloscyllium punctatum]
LLDSTSNEEEVNETQPWAKPLVQLWQNKPHNFQAEKEYNEEVSKMEPYCAICSLFFPYYQLSTRKKMIDEQIFKVRDKSSLVLLSNFVYSSGLGKK